MSLINVAFRASALAIAFGVSAGCATSETTAFRSLSAADHERAAERQIDPSARAAHMEAASKLRETERSVCVDIPAPARDSGPLANPAQITGVEVVSERVYPKAPPQPVGVAVTVRAEPGLTEQWLGRLIECHLAHQAVVGREADRDPLLSVSDATISVSSTATGFRITFTSNKTDVARELVDRGKSMIEPPSVGRSIASRSL